MRIAIVAAGFTAGEADKLRRAMATFRHTGTIHTFRDKFVSGMLVRGYERAFAERCFAQIEGFGEYGFPESHAASFALLVYVSAWVKHHYPEAFCAAILNSQPMGFYAPAQLVRDAREHGVAVRAPDVNASDWDCTLEPFAVGDADSNTHGLHPHASNSPAGDPLTPPLSPGGRGSSVANLATLGAKSLTERVRGDVRQNICAPASAVRLGLRLIAGLREADAQAIVAARGAGYAGMSALRARSGVGFATLERLANADAFRSIGLDRRRALWEVKGLAGRTPPDAKDRRSAATPKLIGPEHGDLFAEPPVALPRTRLGEHVVEDYRTTGLSLKAHPCAFFRDELKSRGVITSQEHWDEGLKGRRVFVAGLVLVRQRPGTAKGVIFLTLEDETGIVNVVVWPKVFEANRRILMTSQFLLVHGRIEREGIVIHVVASRVVDLTARLCELSDGHAALPDPAREPSEGSWKTKSRDFR
jgi:error-prone DNA polymerase